jgi:hypothetical protein
MGKYPKAKVVPFSSVVGSSVTLHDPETERVIGQLAILNVGGDTPEDWKQRSIAVAEDTAKRINAHDYLIAALAPFAEAFAKADDPGMSDLDNEQPISLRVSLGAWRKARSAYRAAVAKAGAP